MLLAYLPVGPSRDHSVKTPRQDVEPQLVVKNGSIWRRRTKNSKRRKTTTRRRRRRKR